MAITFVGLVLASGRADWMDRRNRCMSESHEVSPERRKMLARLSIGAWVRRGGAHRRARGGIPAGAAIRVGRPAMAARRRGR